MKPNTRCLFRLRSCEENDKEEEEEEGQGSIQILSIRPDSLADPKVRGFASLFDSNGRRREAELDVP